jgi:hypothetical protein
MSTLSRVYGVACASGNAVAGQHRVSGRPIFVTGNGRSGTTWLGETLSRAPGLLYYREPCHPERNRMPEDSVDPIWSTYLQPGDRDPYFEQRLGAAFQGHIWRGSGLKTSTFLRRLATKPRILVKEIATFMSLEWVVDRWDPQVLVIMRHPAAYAASVNAQYKKSSEILRLRRLCSDSRLRENYLSDLAGHLDKIDDIMEATVASWAIRTRVVLRALDANPDWQLIHYEDLAHSPIDEFRRLFAALDLDWSDGIETWIADRTQRTEADSVTVRKSSERINIWKKRLSETEITRIRRTLEPFDLPFYATPDDWA